MLLSNLRKLLDNKNIDMEIKRKKRDDKLLG